MRFTSPTVALATLLLSLSSAVAQTPVTCNIKPFNTVPGPTLTHEGSASSINRSGNIVGLDARGRAYIRFANGSRTLIPMPVPLTNPTVDHVTMGKRNANGATVGWVQFVDPTTNTVEARGFINFGGTTTLSNTTLIGINKFGNMLAAFPAFTNPGFAIKVLRSTGTQLIPIPAAFQRNLQPQAISDTGVIVGNYVLQNSSPDPDGTVHGFVEANGQFHDFAFPGQFANTFISDINAAGLIVGNLEGGASDAFLYKDGTFFQPTFVFPSGFKTTRNVFINGVNGFGTIVGSFFIGGRSGPFIGSCGL